MAGPVTMGSARFLNIFLGASPGVAGLFFYNDNFLLTRLLLVCILMLLYVLAISILSRMEVGSVKSIRNVIGPYLIIFATIAMIVFGVVDRIFQIDSVVCLILFASIIIVTFKRTIFQDYSSIGIQKAIKTMVLSIIVLDSVFVSGAAGLYYGLATLLLIIPSIVLARELYVT
jgi:4-hydroxybenzoate polyprenyltransferase